MTRRRLMTALKHIRFDDILQHVEVPHIIIEGNDSLPNTPKLRDYSAKTDLGGNGRADLVFIFRWLRSKGVQTIIQVIVDDLGSTAHGDESIEKALSGFGVEIWNWKKRDLCSEVIINTAPNVQVVYLYWSGNNAVLRGWCDEGGLKKLKELRKIHIHGQQGFDSYSRTESNLEYFKSRMIATNPNIEITWDGLQAVREPQAAKAALPQLPRQPAQDHWIKCMTEFRRFLFQAEANFNKSQNMAVEDMIDQPVKVALIDDGININELEYYPVGGRSFCPRTEDKAFNYPYYVSSSGHGTVMASLIYRICPRAQLYVLKLADHLGRDGSRQITAKSAARAISEAVRMQVHVISMSWTIDPPKDEKTRNELESAIGEAVKKKILLFCSASDGGAKEDHSYPWIAARDRIFRIGGAHASGRTDDEVGSTSQINFTFPGNDVILEGVGSNHEVKYRTGSSVATALAAGLAALILYCVQIRILRASKEDAEVYKSYFRQLTDHDQMVKVFRRSIGVTEESNYKYIAVWDTFEKPIKLSKEKDPERWIDLIARVGEELCMKISTS
ncbi:putative intracellular serine protease protein [Daldinia childiae]|uniref:putative intracellular serine protease protein n=1 Tax=Daldinia childiae TaxID=326645 RepID=UPI001445E40A|nr:putative intracellular serine protease protein [Daldinia childiae]KAF3059759.1 putative intracellular serine protease protein [Daldinia childiae]